MMGRLLHGPAFGPAVHGLVGCPIPCQPGKGGTAMEVHHTSCFALGLLRCPFAAQGDFREPFCGAKQTAPCGAPNLKSPWPATMRGCNLTGRAASLSSPRTRPAPADAPPLATAPAAIRAVCRRS